MLNNLPGAYSMHIPGNEAEGGQGYRGTSRLTGNGPADIGSKSAHSPLHSSCHPLGCRRPSQAQSSRTPPSGDLCGYLHTGTRRCCSQAQGLSAAPEVLASQSCWDPSRGEASMSMQTFAAGWYSACLATSSYVSRLDIKEQSDQTPRVLILQNRPVGKPENS